MVNNQRCHQSLEMIYQDINMQHEFTKEEIDRLTKFFEILIKIDQKNKRKSNEQTEEIGDKIGGKNP